MTWVLIMYIYAGTFASGDSVAITRVPGYTSELSCNKAGHYGASLVRNSAKEYRFTCIPVN